MFELLQQRIDALGAAGFPHEPPLEEIGRRLHASGCRLEAAGDQDRAFIRFTHADWGECDLLGVEEAAPMDAILPMSFGLIDHEREQAAGARHQVLLRLRGQREDVLHDRKRLLWYMRRAMGDDGVVAIDFCSTQLWSPDRLDEELAHDAPLDIEALYGIHAVFESDAEDGTDEGGDRTPHWVHTHGLAQLGGFDIDLILPCEQAGGDPMRALAFAILEERAEIDGPPLQLAWPGGVVRFVSTGRFHAKAAERWTRLRENDEFHSTDRAIVCDPRGGLATLFGRPPRPSRFFQRQDLDGCLLHFSEEASALMADRARQTLSVLRGLREEFERFEFPTLAKLAIATEPRDAGGAEHIWFEVHEVRDDSLDATCINEPHAVPGLSAGDRAEHDIAQLSDWAVMTPLGQINPRTLGPAREIRSDPDRFAALMNAFADAADG